MVKMPQSFIHKWRSRSLIKCRKNHQITMAEVVQNTDLMVHKTQIINPTAEKMQIIFPMVEKPQGIDPVADKTQMINLIKDKFQIIDYTTNKHRSST